MKRLAALTVVLATMLVQACGEPELRTGRMLPPIDVQSVDGQSLRWRVEGPQHVLLNIWAPWCAPCVEEMPSLDRLHAARQDLRVVGLAPADDVLLADEFLRKHGIGFPTYFDSTDQIESVLDVVVYPSSLLLSPSGRVLGIAVGPREWDAEEQHRWINQRIPQNAKS